MAALTVITMSGQILAYADNNTQKETIFVKGTRVNGISIGGLTVAEAKAQIESFYAGEYTLTITGTGGEKAKIKGTDVGFQVTLPEGLAQILETQNTTGRNTGPHVDNSHQMSMENRFDEGLLNEKLNELPLLSNSQRIQTADAYITPYTEGQPFSIIKEVQGNDIEPEQARAAIKQAIVAGNKELDLAAAGCYRKVRITAEDEQLNRLCGVLNQCREMKIDYLFGDQKVTLGGAEICTWLTASQDGTILVNQQKAAEYVAGLAAAYDTAGKARMFKTAAGNEVSVSGAYGWQIDQAAETAALTAMIQTGQSQEREPAYSQRAASRSGGDWGGTYVEIDLGGQHVYMVKDHTLVWDAPCVTGNVSKNYTTPEGIYTLYYKQRDRVLRGKKLANGKYEYESPVKYWMPFNGGIGLHDADWRGSFGGGIYKTNGSHGCINLPPSKTAALYDLVEKGMPIICHN